MSRLRKGWAIVALGDIADIRLGKMLDRARTKGKPSPYLRNVNVRWDSIETSDLLTMPFEDHELGRYGIRPGDLLVCEGGEPGRSAVWSQGPTDLKYQKALHRVRLPEGIAGRWVMYSLMRDASTGRLSRRFTGSTIAHLPREKLMEYEVTIPPAAEQQRIVEVLDAHFSRLDAAVAGLDAAQRRLKAYRSSVLKAAVEGRLVPTEAELARKEGRSYESANVLLQRILQERRRNWESGELAKMKAAGKSPVDDRWKKKYRDPAPPPASMLPSLPQGWCWATLDQLSILVRNGHPAPPRESAGIRTLRISAVRPLAVDFQDVRYLAGRPEDFADDLVDIDDLLFTRYNGTPSLVGVCGRVRFLDRPTVHPDKLIKVRLVSAAASPFIEIAANAGKSRRHVESRTRTTAGQAGISGADLKQMPVPLPPREEQERIWSTVEALLTVEATTRRDIDLALRRCTALRQALLKAAFEGTLVDQRSDDEPADVLLARIRSERESAQVTKPKAKRQRKLKAAS